MNLNQSLTPAGDIRHGKRYWDYSKPFFISVIPVQSGKRESSNMEGLRCNTMPQYKVYATWEYSEIRTITAKDRKEAMQKIVNGEYDQVLDSGQFGDFVRIETIEKV
jgi:hypothetical protein